jgi:hypothetical protein
MPVFRGWREQAEAMTDKIELGRLALREEDGMWNAYYALADSMEGAIFLGSIKMALVKRSEAVKDGFMDTMRVALSLLLKDAVGQGPEWETPRTAPAHERRGRN